MTHLGHAFPHAEQAHTGRHMQLTRLCVGASSPIRLIVRLADLFNTASAYTWLCASCNNRWSQTSPQSAKGALPEFYMMQFHVTTCKSCTATEIGSWYACSHQVCIDSARCSGSSQRVWVSSRCCRRCVAGELPHDWRERCRCGSRSWTICTAQAGHVHVSLRAQRGLRSCCRVPWRTRGQGT